MAVLGVLVPSTFQDFMPGYVAATLVRQGQPSEVYLPSNTHTLFDASPAFIEVAARSAPPGARIEGAVTAFVSSPPALLLYLPLTYLSYGLSLIHISEPTRLLSISYAVFCLKK